MKKLINYRPLFYCFLALFGAILFAKPIFLSDWLIISVFILIVIVLCTTCFLRKKLKTLLCILLFIFLGFGLYTVEMSAYDVPAFPNNSALVGRVSGESATYGIRQYIVLEDVSINGKEISQKVYFYQYGAPYLSAGDKIAFNANLSRVAPLKEDKKVQSSLYKKNCYYTANKASGSIVVLGSSQTVSESVQSAVKGKLLLYMSEDNAAVAYAMLFGDKSSIDSETKYDYQTSGISHILAVSGLHIGIIVGMLYWILKKLKTKNWLILLIVSCILIFYCYLCGFSASVVRATIMSICLIFANSFGRKYDSLSAIGLSGLLILFFRPLFAFDVGFQLSFGCVIGIAIFYKSVFNFIKKPIKRFILPNFIAKPLATTLSTQFLILPILITTFNGVSFLSIFINLLIVPIFTVAFIVSFVATPLVFISGFFGNLFWFSNLLMNFINTMAAGVSSLSWSIIPNFKFAFAAFVSFFALMFVCSRMFLVDKKTKLASSLGLVILTTVVVGLLQLA